MNNLSHLIRHDTIVLAYRLALVDCLTSGAPLLSPESYVAREGLASAPMSRLQDASNAAGADPATFLQYNP